MDSLSMGMCSYTWKERDPGKGWIEKRCQKETWGDSDEFCIFHDPSPEKDVDLFKEKLEEQMKSETERHNFVGYYFPVNWDFSGKEFEITADFSRATFQGTAYFSGATFQDADFSRATFQDADFSRATFQDADFREATFQDADFREATFQDAYFRAITVKESFNFNPEEVSGIIDLQESKFFFSGSITINLEKAKFHHAHLQDVAFIDCEWPENYIIYEEKEMKDDDVNLTFKELETIYRDLKQNMQSHGDYTTAGEFYYREMEMRRKGTETRKKRLWLEIYRGLAGYGEKPERTAFSSALTIFTFAFFYGISGCLHYTVRNPCLYQQIKDSIYFSFVTFTTLGLGDIRPLNDLGKLLICCEAIIGAFLIALCGGVC